MALVPGSFPPLLLAHLESLAAAAKAKEEAAKKKAKGAKAKKKDKTEAAPKAQKKKKEGEKVREVGFCHSMSQLFAGLTAFLYFLYFPLFQFAFVFFPLFLWRN